MTMTKLNKQGDMEETTINKDLCKLILMRSHHCYKELDFSLRHYENALNKTAWEVIDNTNSEFIGFADSMDFTLARVLISLPANNLQIYHSEDKLYVSQCKEINKKDFGFDFHWELSKKLEDQSLLTKKALIRFLTQSKKIPIINKIYISLKKPLEIIITRISDKFIHYKYKGIEEGNTIDKWSYIDSKHFWKEFKEK